MSIPACLICGAPDTAFLFQGPIEKQARMMKREGARYYYCHRCTGLTQHPVLSDEEYRLFYEELQRSDAMGFDDQRVPRKHLKQKVRDAAFKREQMDLLGLDLLIPKRARVLEVGPAEGTLLKTLADEGHDVLGIEPHDRYAVYAREVFGLDVRTEYFGQGVNTVTYDLAI